MMKSLSDNLKVTIEENKQPQQKKMPTLVLVQAVTTFFSLKNKINLQH